MFFLSSVWCNKDDSGFDFDLLVDFITFCLRCSLFLFSLQKLDYVRNSQI